MSFESFWARCTGREKKLQRRRQEVGLAIEGEKGDIEHAFASAERVGEAGEAVKERESAIEALDKLLARVANAKDKDELDWIEEEVSVWDLRRAYILPEQELPIEAEARVAEAQEWGLPAEVMNGLRKWQTKVENSKGSERRMWLNQVLDDFNYRDDYLDWYEDLRKLWTRVSVSVCLASLAAALLLGLLLKCLVLAFAFAGASGAALSVLHNQPPVGVYGDVASGRQAMFIRFVTGIVAAVVGLGLLGSGIVAVGMPQHDGSFVSPASLIHTCTSAGRENDCGSADMLLLHRDWRVARSYRAGADGVSTSGDRRPTRKRQEGGKTSESCRPAMSAPSSSAPKRIIFLSRE